MPSIPFRVRLAAQLLSSGAVVAYPTEAVWGLGCDPADEEAVMRLLELKQRPVEKGLILVASHIDQVDWLLSGLERGQRSRLELSWPGPTTWLVPHGGQVPEWICGEHDSVAIRVSAHPLVQQLCNAFGGPLVSTSANVAGFPAAIEQHQVWRYFGAGIDDLVPGRLGGMARPSTIRDVMSDEIIRPG